MASSSNQIDSEHPLRVLKKKQKNKEYEENEGIELCYLYILLLKVRAVAWAVSATVLLHAVV